MKFTDHHRAWPYPSMENIMPKKATSKKQTRARKQATPSEIAKARKDDAETASGVCELIHHGHDERDDALDRNAPKLTAAQIAAAEVHNAGLKIFKAESQPPADPDTIYLKAKDEDDAFVELKKNYGEDFPRHLVEFTVVDSLPDDEVLANDFSVKDI